MTNMTGMTCADEWIEAICQILADARDLWGFAVKEQGPSCRRAHSPGPEPYPATGNGQLLLLGIAEPYRWDFGKKV